MNRLLPLTIFLCFIALFAYRLVMVEHGDTPNLVPSAMLGKPVPVMDLPLLTANEKRFTNADFIGHVTLVNFFASWCVPCRVEHPHLAALANQKLRLIGMAYKNNPKEAAAWLHQLGNPYAIVAVDRHGAAGIDFGVSGVPESYLIDQQGIIRFKQTGPWTAEAIERELLPRIAELNR